MSKRLTIEEFIKTLKSGSGSGGSSSEYDRVLLFNTGDQYVMLSGSYERVKALLTDTITINGVEVPKKIPDGQVINNYKDGRWGPGGGYVQCWGVDGADVVFQISGVGDYYLHPDGTIEPVATS